MRLEPDRMLQDFNASEINSFRRVITASDRDRIIFHLLFDIFHLPFVSESSPRGRAWGPGLRADFRHAANEINKWKMSNNKWKIPSSWLNLKTNIHCSH